MEACFDRFALSLPVAAVDEMPRQGACDEWVDHWAPRVPRPPECTPDALCRELAEYGAWDEAQLADDAANWERIVWIAAGNIREEMAAEA